jgi:hypothetical protein
LQTGTAQKWSEPMTWMRVTLRSSDVARRARLQGAFEGFFLAMGEPRGAAMFERKPSRDERAFYFSPDAVVMFGQVLAGYAAAACEAPPLTGTTLLAGRSDAKRLLAPGREGGGSS